MYSIDHEAENNMEDVEENANVANFHDNSNSATFTTGVQVEDSRMRMGRFSLNNRQFSSYSNAFRVEQ